jgi:hypothetical protein
MSQSSDSSTRALATLVTALGITIGATPATLHAQAPVKAPTSEAVQEKHTPEAVQTKVQAKEAVQTKVQAKEAVQDKAAVQKKEAVQHKGDAAVPTKEAVQHKGQTAAPARPL